MPLTGTVDRTKLQMGPANVYFDSVHLGYMDDSLEIEIAVTASPLTGAQAGTSPLDKVVTGGSVMVKVPLKELSLSKMATGLLNSGLVSGLSGTRLDFKNKVGLSARGLAKELRIVSLVGGVETTDTSKIYVIPQASPADSAVKIPFSPTQQRVVEISFEAWPSDATGRWMYLGDMNPWATTGADVQYPTGAAGSPASDT